MSGSSRLASALLCLVVGLPQGDPPRKPGEPVVLRVHTGAVCCIAFSPDGTMLATAGVDKTVRIIDSRTGEAGLTLKGHEQEVFSVAFSPDGMTLASGSSDSTIRLWDVRTGGLIRLLHNDVVNKSPVLPVAFSTDGKHVASGDIGSEDPVKLWDVGTGRYEAMSGHDAKAASLAFSPDGKRLVAGGDNPGVMTAWNLSTGKLLWRVNRHTHVVSSVRFSPDGLRLVSGSRDRTVRLWDSETGAEKTVIKVESDVLAVAFSPDGGSLVVGSEDGTAKFYDSKTGAPGPGVAAEGAAVNSIAFSPDGKRLAAACADGTVKLWEVGLLPKR